ncbi:MAG: hypothetical protein B6D61_05810 [Bacteroidetes bacterium 4484_249]|nr:MAG: hypothetical protein B6D61_05810 [Bacteroidetes bacterium 4484_249]
MIAIKGIFENGVVKLENPVNVKRPLKVIVTFIDEDINFNNQLNDLKTEASDHDEHIAKLKKKYSDLPILWGEGIPSIDDLSGIWKDKEITIERLREKAWKRN